MAAAAGGPGSIAEKFSRGEAVHVEVDKIERALAELWMEATRSGDGTMSRAALWNVVVPTRARDLDRTKTIVDELAPLLPARVILLAEEEAPAGQPPEAAQAEDAGLRASIESNVVARSSGARVVYSEEITLRGRRGDVHFGALVRALVVPGLPTATLWTDASMSETLLRRQLMPATDRLVLDSGLCARPRQLVEVQRCADLAAPGKQTVADLGWLRLASFRLLFAGLFDAPVGGAPLQRARRVTIHHRPGAEASALLLGAWLASTLGWLFAAAEPAGAESGARFRFDRAAGQGPGAGSVEVMLASSPGECGTSGIVALELVAEGPNGQGEDELYAVRRTEQNHATLVLPIAPPRAVKLDSRRDAELCLAALGPAGGDALYLRCLALAARLAISSGT